MDFFLGRTFYMNLNAVQIFSAVEKFKPCTTFENNILNIDMKYYNYK